MRQVFKRFYSDNHGDQNRSRSFDSYYQEIKSKPREAVAEEARQMHDPSRHQATRA
jgi:hypothetical protein